MKQFILLALIVAMTCLFSACKHNSQIMNSKKSNPQFFKIGHRGARGLMPENTIQAMKTGIKAGANTIEMDVHISKDGKVIVYHDASFNPDYTVMPDGTDIEKQERGKYIFFQMNYETIKTFVIGTKKYPDFPQQQRLIAYTPLLSELIDSVENYTKANQLSPVNYLVEIKSNEKTDGIEQPVPEEFIRILMADLDIKELGNRLIIQSFDRRPLQVLHRDYPSVALGLLTSDKNSGFDQNISQLGFNPSFYNPYYLLVADSLVKKCHLKKIKIAPWTVNDLSQMEQLRKLGVDGIITDYPDLLEKSEKQK